jgi:hypothetical protein
MSMLYDSTLLYDQPGLAYNGLPTGIPGLPNVGVFLAFNASPYEPNPMWTDVTEYVRQIPSIRRARSDDWSTFTGTASLVLNNRDQRFNPFNTLSPYNGLLKPRMQIKIVAVAGENDYNLFRGYVAGWPVDWSEQGLDSTVTIECFDALALLASEQLPPDQAEKYILSLNPRNFWPLSDPIDQQTYLTQQLKDLGSNPKPLTANGTFRTSNVASMAEGITSNTITVSEPGSLNTWRYQESAAGTLSTFSMAFWFQKFPNSTSPIAIFASAVQFNIFYDLAQPGLQPRFNWTILDPAFFGGQTANITLDINEPHHLIFNVVNNRVTTAWVDGQALTVGSYSGTNVFNTIVEKFEWANGTKQHIAIFPRVLTASEATTLYQLSANRLNETTASRFNRLMANSPFPTSLTNVSSAATSVVSAFTVGGNSLVSELNIVNDSEGGELYTNKDGVITFTERGSQFKGRSSTTQAVFKDDGTALDYADNFNLGFDADSIVNELQVQITGGGNVVASDVSSQTAYGRTSQTINTQLASLDSAQDLANSKLVIFADPIPTVSPLEVGTTRSLTEWQTLLSLEVLDQIEITRSSPVGSPFFERLLVNEIVHSISTEDWSMQVTGSARYTGVLILDDPVLGLLDKFVLG